MFVNDETLETKVLQAVDDLMMRHRAAVGTERKGERQLELVGPHGGPVTLLRQGANAIATFTGVSAGITVFGRDHKLMLTGKAQDDPAAFLASLAGLACSLPSYNVPYGRVVNGKVFAIYVRNRPPKKTLYLPEGVRQLPSGKFFERRAALTDRSAWFWQQVKAGSMIPLQDRFQASWYAPGGCGLRVTDDSGHPSFFAAYVGWDL